MRRFVATLLAIGLGLGFAAPASGRSEEISPYIVNGIDAPSEFGTFVVRIVTTDDKLCSGTLIDARWVLTAGHCIADSAEIFGSGVSVRGLRDLGSASGIRHPYYLISNGVPRFDFGLYEFDVPIDVSGIQLPEIIGYDDAWSWVAGQPVVTLGWGLTSADGSLSSTLQRGELVVESDATCADLDLALGASFDPTTAICANDSSTSACNGDSGGPLLATNALGRYEILGVTSYGPEDCNGHSAFGWSPAGLAWFRSVTGLPLGSGAASSTGRTVTRIFGMDRFETAAAVVAFWDESDTVFVATGGKFPDALAAGAAASSMDSPVLLVNAGNVPEATRYQIRRLAPSTIYVAGGPAAISDGVVAELGAIVGSEVIRLGGADRYETSDLLGDLADDESAGERVWVASGRDFADPLVASTAAAVFGEPFVLIDGVNPLAPRTLERLTRLAPSKIVILGPDAFFSAGVRSALATVAPLQTLTGGDASWRSAVVWGDFTSSRWASLATVDNFPDALAAVPFSSMDPASPLMLVPKGCVPAAVRDQITRLGSDRLALFGGPAALSESVESLQPC